LFDASARDDRRCRPQSQPDSAGRPDAGQICRRPRPELRIADATESETCGAGVFRARRTAITSSRSDGFRLPARRCRSGRSSS
jgi:hypothetical protein